MLAFQQAAKLQQVFRGLQETLSLPSVALLCCLAVAWELPTEAAGHSHPTAAEGAAEGPCLSRQPDHLYVTQAGHC